MICIAGAFSQLGTWLGRPMSSYTLGVTGENQAASYFRSRGYTVVDRNWRTRWCEIDIIAKKDGCLHFVEVKYRTNPKWGTAIDYLTPNKLRQMKFAANLWVHRYRWTGNYKLLALAIDGDKALEYTIDD